MEFDGNWLHARALFFSFLTTPSGQLQINSRIVWFMPRTCFSFLRGMTYISCLLCPAKRAVVQRNVSECQLYTSPVNVVLVQVFSLPLGFWICLLSMADLESYHEKCKHGKSSGRLSSLRSFQVIFSFKLSSYVRI